jgi:hypothetical protein
LRRISSTQTCPFTFPLPMMTTPSKIPAITRAYQRRSQPLILLTAPEMHLIWMKVSVNPMRGLIALVKMTKGFIPSLEARRYRQRHIMLVHSRSAPVLAGEAKDGMSASVVPSTTLSVPYRTSSLA